MLDSCPRHMTPHRFHKYIPLIESHPLYMGDGRTQQVVRIGTIVMYLYSFKK
jgi:hypothetical protein